MNTPYNSNSNDPAVRAKALLSYYLQLGYNQNFSADNYSEIGGIIDEIILAVQEQSLEYKLEKLKRLNQYLALTNKQNRELLGRVSKLLSDNAEHLPEAEKEKLSNLMDAVGDFLLED